MNEQTKKLAEKVLSESNFDDEQNIKISLEAFSDVVRECAWDMLFRWNAQINEVSHNKLNNISELNDASPTTNT